MKQIFFKKQEVADRKNSLSDIVTNKKFELLSNKQLNFLKGGEGEEDSDLTFD